MSEIEAREATRELLWRLWTELGVPGLERHQRGHVIDLEPLVVFTPGLIDDDPRLAQLVFDWCLQHGERIATSRLKGLLDDAPPAIQERFWPFSADLRATAGLRWPTGDAGGSIRDHDPRPMRLPLERPALARIRARCLFGIGARADVVCELLARPSSWVRAVELTHIGYSKRSIARVLSDLADARVAVTKAEGNTLLYRLEKSAELDGLLAAPDLAWPRWAPVLRILHLLCRLQAAASIAEPRRQVEAHQIRQELEAPAREVWLHPLPVTRGNPQAFEALATWGRAFLEDLSTREGELLARA